MSHVVRGAMSKYRLSRRGRKLLMADDQRTLVALPKDVFERTWAEILQKEETDLLILDIREEIVEDALNYCYEKYMERQTALFAAHCAAEAWLKLIDWYFYRHDPGEEPSAYPPCYIPKRLESWIPDEMPDPSPKDTWCKHDLNILEDVQEETIKKSVTSSSIETPIIEDVPSEYWFPGKVNLPYEFDSKTESFQTSPLTSEGNMGTESEVLQKVTDYSNEEMSVKESTFSEQKPPTPVDGSLQGAGDSAVDRLRPRRRPNEKSKIFSRASMVGRSKGILPPLDGDSRSRVSLISDCRLRNLREACPCFTVTAADAADDDRPHPRPLAECHADKRTKKTRLETQYEITSEKIDTPPGETVKRK